MNDNEYWEKGYAVYKSQKKIENDFYPPLGDELNQVAWLEGFKFAFCEYGELSGENFIDELLKCLDVSDKNFFGELLVLIKANNLYAGFLIV